MQAVGLLQDLGDQARTGAGTVDGIRQRLPLWSDSITIESPTYPELCPQWVALEDRKYKR